MKIEVVEGKLQITDFDEIEAFTIACKIERDGRRFYQKVASSVEDPHIKDSLTFLVDEEQRHLKLFEQWLYEARSLSSNENEEDILGSFDYGIVWPYEKIEDLETKLGDIRTVLTMGVRVEERSLEFYEKCKGLVSSDSVKGALSRIIQEEGNHRKMLLAIIEHLPPAHVR